MFSVLAYLSKKNIFFILLIGGLLLSGCSSKNYQENDTVGNEVEVSVFDQKVVVPKELYKKALISKDDYSIKFTPSSKNVKAKEFRETRGKNIDLFFKSIPTYTIGFKKKVLVESVVIDSGNFNMIRRHIKRSRDIYINPHDDPLLIPFKSYKKEYKVQLDKFKNDYIVPMDGYKKIVFKKNNVSDDIKFRLIKVETLENQRKVRDWKIIRDPKFFVKAYDQEVLVLGILKSRKDKEKNESLLITVAKNDVKLFRKIQRNHKQMNLPSLSFAQLPKDISISYAIKNFSIVMKTGRYRTYNGKYKKFKTNSLMNFGTSGTYKKNKSIEVNGNNIKIKKGDKKSKDKEAFIDFSKGI